MKNRVQLQLDDELVSLEDLLDTLTTKRVAAILQCGERIELTNEVEVDDQGNVFVKKAEVDSNYAEAQTLDPWLEVSNPMLVALEFESNEP